MSWWKLLSIVLLLYVLIAGFLVPLKPGIINLTPFNIKSHSTSTLTIQGYNTNFKTGEASLQAWLKIDSIKGYKADRLEVKDETHMTAYFAIGDIPRETVDATLLVTNDIDKTALLPSAVRLTKEDVNQPLAMAQMEALPYAEFGTKQGFLFPFRTILYETVRNTFFHVSIWMSMFALLLVGLFHSIKYLIKPNIHADITASSFNLIAIVYGMIGLATGSVWAKFTWGTWWTTDIKLNMAAVSMLIYLAYALLRAAIDDVDKRAKLSAIYSIFAFVAMIPLLFVLPRMTSSLHPGNGGNPALGGEDLDNTLRMVFYPAIIGLFLFGMWIATIRMRIETLFYNKSIQSK